MYKIIGADGKEYGPVSVEQLRQWFAEGRVNGQTQVLAGGAGEWKPFSALQEFSAQPSSAAPPAFSTAQYGSATVPKTNAMAMTGMIMGIVAMTFGFCCCYGIPFNVMGLIFSLVALSQIKKDPQQQGRGMAIAGLILSIASLLISIIAIIFVGASVALPEMMRGMNR